MLTGLGHRAVGRRHHEDGTVHLGRTRDHVLDVVGVTRAVDVGVVTRLGLVLDVRDRDRDTALALFRRLVDLVERLRVRVELRPLRVQRLTDRSRQRRLTVVNVTNGTDVDVRLSPLELRLRHGVLLSDGLLSVLGSTGMLVARLLAANLLDDLFRNVLGNLCVRVELHGVDGAPCVLLRRSPT